MSDLIKVWDDYYSDTTADTAIKDKNFFDLEVGTIVRGLSELYIPFNKLVEFEVSRQ